MSFLSHQGKLCVSVVTELCRLKWSIISNGRFRKGGRGPPYLFEAFMEVCSMLLFVGDVFGYIAVDDHGVVDAERSYAPFLEGFVVCLEVMHIWCMRHPALGITPKDRRWVSSGFNALSLHSVSPLLLLKMVQSVYPFVKDDNILPDRLILWPDFSLRELFIRYSQFVVSLVQDGNVGWCQPLRFTQSIRSVDVYLRTRRVRDSAGFGCVEQHEVCICLSSTFESDGDRRVSMGSVGRSECGEWELYWRLESCSSGESLYEQLRGLVSLEG